MAQQAANALRPLLRTTTMKSPLASSMSASAPSADEEGQPPHIKTIAGFAIIVKVCASPSDTETTLL